MGRYLRISLYLLAFWVFVLDGCGPVDYLAVNGDFDLAIQEQWLVKAYRYDKNGWIYLHIEGTPFERGFQRGYLTANEIDEFLTTIAYIQQFKTGKELDYFVKVAARLFKGKVGREYIEEMRGIAAGMKRAGKQVSYDQILFANGFIDICWYWWPKEKKAMGPGCSAFIATGSATAMERL